jgi:predicted transcriptional regulator
VSAQKTISFRMPAKTVASLDTLASEMDRDRSYLLNEAVENYLDLNRYQMELVEKGIAAAKRGEFVEHEAVRKMIGKMRRRK